MKTVRDGCQLQDNALSIRLGDQIEQLDELINLEGNGEAFFEKTFITQGMQDLISEGIARLAGTSSQAVFHLKQAMGGGKTHLLVGFGLLAKDPALRQKYCAGMPAASAFATAKIAAFNGRNNPDTRLFPCRNPSLLLQPNRVPAHSRSYSSSFGIFVAIGVIGAGVVGYGIYRVAHSIHKAADGQFSINTSKGVITANTSNSFTESDLGIAIYPGAEQGKGGLRMNIAGRSMVSANFLTSDPKDQVIAFYKGKVGPNAQSIMTDSGAQFVTAASNGDSVTVSVAQNTATNDGKTQITIIRASKG